MLLISLSDGTNTANFTDTITSDTGNIMIRREAISGLWSAPASKTSLNERQTGNGAHDIENGRILYSSRTVTIPFALRASSHEELQSLRNSIGMLMGKNITMFVQDGNQQFDLYGFITPEYSDIYDRYTDTGSVTVICPRPEKLSHAVKNGMVYPTSAGIGGLYYGENRKGLVYPLTYGEQETDMRNIITISNDGNMPSYPVMTITGEFDVLQVDWVSSNGTTNTVSYNGHVGEVPLVLDSRSQTANIGGTDMSKNLGYRGFPAIPPMGSVTFSLVAAGSGWMDVSARDTYI